jgi:hypothetical protein
MCVLIIANIRCATPGKLVKLALVRALLLNSAMRATGARRMRRIREMISALSFLLMAILLSTPVPSIGGASQRCSQPVTTGTNPTASDCLYILRTAVGSETCTPVCVCAPKGATPPTATDALICLKKAVGQSVTLNCPAPCGATTTSLPPTTTTTTSTTTTTTGSGSIERGRADYDSRCAFCHAAGSHDPESEFASDLAGDGSLLVPDLGVLDDSMSGIMMSEQEITDMAAFLDSLQ